MSDKRDWVEVEENNLVLRGQNWVQVTDEEMERLRSEKVEVSRLGYEQVLSALEDGLRSGADVDEPEGTRNLTMSDTLAKILVRDLRGDKDDA